MIIVKTKAELNHIIEKQDLAVGFVPTMGALHEGHLSLVEASKKRGLFTVVSIFVNPTQFNDPEDYEKYPVDTEDDLNKLASTGCDLVFIPHRDEVYPSDHDSQYIHEFGYLEKAFEGAYRPGHFRGVGQVVHVLFEAVKPDVAFFGEKDFQQLQVIRALVRKLAANIEVVGLPTVREPDGLAMSSRNRRLSEQERKQSTVLYQALNLAKDRLNLVDVSEIKTDVDQLFAASPHLQLEYFDIIDPDRFESITTKQDCTHPHAVIAAYAGDVRLIDNMRLA